MNKHKLVWKYSQTWVNDHLRITTTCLKRLQFWGPNFNFHNTKLPLNNDHLSTTATNFGSQGWLLYTSLTVPIFSKDIIILKVLEIKPFATCGEWEWVGQRWFKWSLSWLVSFQINKADFHTVKSIDKWQRIFMKLYRKFSRRLRIGLPYFLKSL